MTKPYISVVVTTRNDNYGENMRQRLDMFVLGLDCHAKKHPGLFELVIVEWNPPTDQEPLSTIIPHCEHLDIRVITVPGEYHHRRGPMDEYQAKNVGIRRSQGEFVLVTNPDVLLSYNLVDFLATQKLEPGRIYRCDRYDFDGQGINQTPPNQFIKYAFGRVFRLHGMIDQNSLTVDINLSKNPEKIPVSNHNPQVIHSNAAGDFMLAARDTFIDADGLYQDDQYPGHGDSVSMSRLIRRGLQQAIMKFPCIVLHHDHDRTQDRPDWDPIAVREAAQAPVTDSWGLAGVELEEWSNHVS